MVAHLYALNACLAIVGIRCSQVHLSACRAADYEHAAVLSADIYGRIFQVDRAAPSSLATLLAAGIGEQAWLTGTEFPPLPSLEPACPEPEVACTLLRVPGLVLLPTTVALCKGMQGAVLSDSRGLEHCTSGY